VTNSQQVPFNKHTGSWKNYGVLGIARMNPSFANMMKWIWVQKIEFDTTRISSFLLVNVEETVS
jgi:hypothetical protein